jgi:type II secretory pathway component PulF
MRGMLLLVAGARGPAPTDLLDDSRDPAFQEARRQLLQRSVYLVSVAAIMVGILTFIMVKIVPAFEAIFDDFGMQLPPITTTLIALSNSFDFSRGPAVAAILALNVAGILLLGLAAAICYLCDVPVLQPLTDRLAFSRIRAHLLRLLSLAIEHGKPIDQAIEQLCGGWGEYPSALARRRLTRAHAIMHQGASWQDALAQTKLLSARDASLLASAQLAGNLPWAMRMLADRKLRTSAFRWTVVQQMLFTLLILLIGALVLWICVALIYPLARMVLDLA